MVRAANGWAARGAAKRDLQLPAVHSTWSRGAHDSRSVIGVDGLEWTGMLGRVLGSGHLSLVEASERSLISRKGLVGSAEGRRRWSCIGKAGRDSGRRHCALYR